MKDFAGKIHVIEDLAINYITERIDNSLYIPIYKDDTEEKLAFTIKVRPGISQIIRLEYIRLENSIVIYATTESGHFIDVDRPTLVNIADAISKYL